MNRRTHWMLLIVNLPGDRVYVLNPVNHDVSGLKNPECTQYVSFPI
jgi:hypothetical protein